MTTVNIKIWDDKNEAGEPVLNMEGTLDNPEAVNLPPTPALIVGSYLAAHSSRVCAEAQAWFESGAAQ